MVWSRPAVFPAHAGMSPGKVVDDVHNWGFPRSRGDEPLVSSSRANGTSFSPLTRG